MTVVEFSGCWRTSGICFASSVNPLCLSLVAWSSNSSAAKTKKQPILCTCRSVLYSPLLRLEKRALDGVISLSLDPWAPIALLFLLPWRQHHTHGFKQLQFTENYESFLPPHNLPVCTVTRPLFFWQFLFLKKKCHCEQASVPLNHKLVLNNT